jgi:uncharacterized protein (TIGR02266 family)
MNQDTRKDQRVKVVSLQVRYKSATVDEFIENHSHDVSRGGIFVKTPSPFVPGTLLKFEIRLAGDVSVIVGVGRVVWKREPNVEGTTAERPAGMGVKFIKIDDASRAIIDRLVAQKADAGSAYTAEQPLIEPAGHPTTLRGLLAASPDPPPQTPLAPFPVRVPAPAMGAGVLPVPPPSTSPGFGSAPPAAASSASVLGAPRANPRGLGPPPPSPSKPATVIGMGAVTAPGSVPPLMPPARKATMLGVGVSSSHPPAARSEPPASHKPAAEPVFPYLPDQGSQPARDQTVMKQAAELLEEALREAGGSLEDVEEYPVVSRSAPPPKAADAAKSGDNAVVSTAQAGLSPSQPLAPAKPVAAVAAPPRKLSDDLAPKAKSNGGGAFVVWLLVLAVCAGGAYAWQSGKLNAWISPEVTPQNAAPTATASVSADPAPPPTAAPTAPAPTAQTPDASPGGTDAAVSDAGAADASITDAGAADAHAPKSAAKPNWKALMKVRPMPTMVEPLAEEPVPPAPAPAPTEATPPSEATP